MGWLAIIIVGALAGWIASRMMGTDAQQGALANILIGAVGALLGGWLFGQVLGFDTALAAGSISFWGIVWAIIGAVILIAVLKSVRVLR